MGWSTIFGIYFPIHVKDSLIFNNLIHTRIFYVSLDLVYLFYCMIDISGMLNIIFGSMISIWYFIFCYLLILISLLFMHLELLYVVSVVPLNTIWIPLNQYIDMSAHLLSINKRYSLILYFYRIHRDLNWRIIYGKISLQTNVFCPIN